MGRSLPGSSPSSSTVPNVSTEQRSNSSIGDVTNTLSTSSWATALPFGPPVASVNDTLIGRAAPDDDATRDLLDALLEAGPENPAWSQLDRLVRRSADAVGRSNNPPSPDGDRWTRAELEDLAQSFWAAGNVEKVIVGASDDQHLRRRVITALSYFPRKKSAD